jgi:general secretion pathway protein G
MSKRSSREEETGFTMIEIMLVLALIGLIMGAVVVGLRRNTVQGQVQVARMHIQQLGAMFLQHRVANSGDCPTMAKWIACGASQLCWLRSIAGGFGDPPRVPISIEDQTLKSEPKDPWGHPLAIVCPGEHEEGGADIVSLGPDGRPGSKDDIESWKLQ